MYIYHFWPLSMHCKKTTTIRCFLEATYDLLVVLRKPWICTLCFDAHFSKFRDFWWFLVIFNRKMDILDHFWGPLTASSPKVTIYLPLTPRTLSKPVKNPLKTPIFDHFGPLGLEDLLRASQTHARDLQFWSFWPLFLLKKSIFVILPIRGQWKCHFDPILTPFWALLSPNFGPWPKMCLFVPFAWRDLEGPWGTLFWP